MNKTEKIQMLVNGLLDEGLSSLGKKLPNDENIRYYERKKRELERMDAGFQEDINREIDDMVNYLNVKLGSIDALHSMSEEIKNKVAIVEDKILYLKGVQKVVKVG